MRSLIVSFALVLSFLGSGCATYHAVDARIADALPSASEPIPPATEEVRILYARGIKKAVDDVLPKMGVKKSEKVWVLNRTTGENGDQIIDRLTYDSIVQSLKESKTGTVVERDDDVVRAMYVEYAESGRLGIKNAALSKKGKLDNPDVIVAYRLVRMNVRHPGYITLVVRLVSGFVAGLFSDGQVNWTDGLRLAIRLDVIDLKTGVVRKSRLIEHVEEQPVMFVPDIAFDEAALAAAAAADEAKKKKKAEEDEEEEEETSSNDDDDDDDATAAAATDDEEVAEEDAEPAEEAEKVASVTPDEAELCCLENDGDWKSPRKDSLKALEKACRFADPSMKDGYRACLGLE